MRADDFVRILGPREVADLRAGVDFGDERAGGCVPEFYASVRGSAARGEERGVVRGPGDGLYGGGVVAEFPEGGFSVGRVAADIPDHEFVVVAS